ncbi:MAG: hypothetical protein KIS66_17450 [Fimbriimonadaceae bacterium]|nr:hypothetical protein [Fimbriimonadaceae bacterium]
MKLNLLPKTISEAKAGRAAIVFSILLFIILLGAGGALYAYSDQQLKQARDRVAALKPDYDRVVANARVAETKMADASQLYRNASLAEAMLAHNTKYPDLYDELFQYIPSYYRLISMSAAPIGSGQCQVTLVGTLQTFQQYADITLALRRFPDVVSVQRSGYQIIERYVPNLQIGDQVAYPIRPGEAPIPTDPIDRMNYLIANAQGSSGFQGIGGFGSEDSFTPRGAMLDWSVVTMTLIVSRDLQVPDPNATLGAPAGGSAGGGGFAGVPGGRIGGPPAGVGGPGGPPPGFGGPPAGSIPRGIGSSSGPPAGFSGSTGAPRGGR